MMASRFRAVYWIGACSIAALACYLVSQTVAAERAELTKVERRIAQTQRDIRQLETEADTLSRLAQVERWNADAFALSAPTARQFLASDLQLASLNLPATPALPPTMPAPRAASNGLARVIPVRAEATAPATAEPVAQPAFRHATYVKPLAAAEPALVQEAAFERPLDASFGATLGRLASAERGGKR